MLLNRRPGRSRACLRVFALFGTITMSAQASAALDLDSMSIEELAEVEVTSVSKRPQQLSEAPAAIYVISHDDIIRSGALILPEMLRLAPNLQVAQTTANQYIISARGFSGNISAQNFSNKLLVLIDGRTVYTPLYSGVYWDMQDVLPQDIDRIEVISGPGATLWGANAVNGVINIITRNSAATQGALFNVEAGTADRSAGLRYGGQAGATLSYRFYVRGYEADQTRTSNRLPAHDDWSRVQGGFRLDWDGSARDKVTLQGDAYGGTRSQPDSVDEDIRGRNLLLRWNHTTATDSNLQAQAYYDRTERETQGPGRGGGFYIDTYDFDVQHSFSLGSRQRIVWGGGFRLSHYDILGAPNFFFTPARQSLRLFNGFVQDSIRVGSTIDLVLGMKVEDGPYSNPSLLPNARVSWRATDGLMLWASASRAIRSATPFDRDVVEKIGAIEFLIGGADFRSEKVTAFEGGVRAQPSSRLSLSISAFYNQYDDLRSIEFNRATLLPLEWGNMIQGHSYGFEAWGGYNIAPWWKLSAAVNYLRQRYAFKPSATSLLLPGLPGVEQQGSDPEYQASLKSSMNLGSRTTLDGTMRFIGKRPNPNVPAYVELDARAAYDLTPSLQLSIIGRNLLHRRHREYTLPEANLIPRKVLVALQWRL